ncbi:hypothetical protein IFM89_011507 [Coptis chinensis]|uniref:Uncharacterized protein n=1 Tax=Coptis chinensis TaxID=261450 RepID=A0A835IDI0_9MAGN|nr:hypothetical protein IFM89_011507 [Coptis chinensis]
MAESYNVRPLNSFLPDNNDTPLPLNVVPLNFFCPETCATSKSPIVPPNFPKDWLFDQPVKPNGEIELPVFYQPQVLVPDEHGVVLPNKRSRSRGGRVSDCLIRENGHGAKQVQANVSGSEAVRGREKIRENVGTDVSLKRKVVDECQRQEDVEVKPSLKRVVVKGVRAVRKFPPELQSQSGSNSSNCVRVAPSKECRKSVDSLKENREDAEEQKTEKILEDDATVVESKEQANVMKESEVEFLEVKKVGEVISRKRKYVDEFHTVNESQGQESVELEPSFKRVIVLGLRTLNKCPPVLQSQSGSKALSCNEKVDRGSGSPEKELDMGSTKDSKTGSLRRNLRRKSVDENLNVGQSQLQQSVARKLFKERVVVQALMAAPNCPWGLQTDKDGKSLVLSEKVDTRCESSEEKQALDSAELSKNTGLETEFPGKSVDKYYRINHSETQEYVGLVPSNGKVVVQALSPAPISTRGRENRLLGLEVVLPMQQPKEHDLTDEDDCSVHDKEDDTPLVQTLKKMDLSLIPFGLNTSINVENGNEAGVTRSKVRETLRLFQTIVRKLLQDEESKSVGIQADYRRFDLLAAKILKERNKCVNTGKKILGAVPGVEVGDEFHYRAELSIIGLHRQFQGGIDYLRRNGKILATSIVASEVYADDVDNPDVLVYTGQGGNPVGTKKAEDQRLEQGNLYLKNSIDEKTPVRVIRGFKETKGIKVLRDFKEKKGSDMLHTRGKRVSTYTYDGLYMVERYWKEKGNHGTMVFKFQLRRIPGQPELAIKELKKSMNTRVREGRCIDDISQGKEKIPIGAVNIVDNEKPHPFEYITSMTYPLRYNLSPPMGCGCTDGCSDSVKCLCVARNGGEIPFNHDGAIVEAKPLIYECGPSCKCPPSCYNRVSQHGIKFQLEIFKTESRGWGVRSLSSIPSGSFICEYTGELLQEREAEQRTGNDEYLFDIGQGREDHAVSMGPSNLIPPDLKSSSSCVTVGDVAFTIDAAECGSIARFINHSCTPNLYAQDVLYDHDDKRMPHVMLFAAENIPPLQELTYHYNYELDQVRDSDGNIKKKDCYCGSDECTGRMY